MTIDIRGSHEDVLLYMMFRNNKIIVDVLGVVKDNYFKQTENRIIFRAIEKVYFRDKFITYDSIDKETEGRYKKTLEVIKNTGTSNKWEFYANSIKRHYMKDEVEDLLNSFNMHDIQNIESEIAKTTNSLSSLLVLSQKTKKTSMGELCMDMTKRIEQNFKDKCKYKVSTGFASVDDVLFDFIKGYYLIGARASLGKSALCFTLACNLARQGIKTMYFSLEMSSTSLGYRETAGESKIHISRLKSGSFTTTDLAKINNGLGNLFELDLDISDGGDCSLSTIVSEIKREHAVNGTQAFFIDHASIITDNSSRERPQQYINISRTFQRLQRDLNIFIILAVQLNRDAENKRPTTANIRESGAFEQDADTIIFLHRERIIKTETGFPTEVIVIKNREGATGIANLMFQSEITRFRDMTNDELKDWEAQQTGDKK